MHRKLDEATLVASETDFRAEKEEVFGLWEKSSKQRAAVLEMWILGVVNRRGHESWPSWTLVLVLVVTWVLCF